MNGLSCGKGQVPAHIKTAQSLVGVNSSGVTTELQIAIDSNAKEPTEAVAVTVKDGLLEDHVSGEIRIGKQTGFIRKPKLFSCGNEFRSVDEDDVLVREPVGRVNTHGNTVNQDVPKCVQSSVDFDQSKLSSFVN